MTRKLLSSTFIGLIALLMQACQPSPEIRVISSGAFAATLDVLAPRFEQASGIRVITAYGASAGPAATTIPSRLASGEPADVIIPSRASLDNLQAEGQVRPGTAVDLVRSSIGMAVISGAAKPDISTTAAFIDTVVAADSLGYSAGASGNYLSMVLFPRLGIWDRIESKARLVEGELVANPVARGEIEIGFQQISEILPVAGADFVGPIPEELQRVTTFSAGITERSQNPEAAAAFIEFLASAAVADTIEAMGLVPIVRERQ